MILGRRFPLDFGDVVFDVPDYLRQFMDRLGKIIELLLRAAGTASTQGVAFG